MAADAGMQSLAAAPVPRGAQVAAATAAPSTFLSAEQIQELTYAFGRFDVNGTGRVTAAELGAVLRQLGEDATQEEVEQMVLEFDTDGDGGISLPEFIRLNAMAAAMEAGSSSGGGSDGGSGRSGGGGGILEDVFRTFDADKDGFICPAELQMIFCALGEESVTLEECVRMIWAADMDGDGQVDFREFEALMFAPSPPASPGGSGPVS